jgi:hypothetical protein
VVEGSGAATASATPPSSGEPGAPLSIAPEGAPATPLDPAQAPSKTDEQTMNGHSTATPLPHSGGKEVSNGRRRQA